jgi:uncharacterized protein YjbJ (UPF0337 family)
MGSINDKVRGAVNETVGSAKQVAGKAVDSPELEGEGVLQELKGKGQTALGEAKEVIADVLEAPTRRRNSPRAPRTPFTARQSKRFRSPSLRGGALFRRCMFFDVTSDTARNRRTLCEHLRSFRLRRAPTQAVS